MRPIACWLIVRILRRVINSGFGLWDIECNLTSFYGTSTIITAMILGGKFSIKEHQIIVEKNRTNVLGRFQMIKSFTLSSCSFSSLLFLAVQRLYLLGFDSTCVMYPRPCHNGVTTSQNHRKFREALKVVSDPFRYVYRVAHKVNKLFERKWKKWKTVPLKKSMIVLISGLLKDYLISVTKQEF